jgi:hypothetical protein
MSGNELNGTIPSGVALLALGYLCVISLWLLTLVSLLSLSRTISLPLPSLSLCLCLSLILPSRSLNPFLSPSLAYSLAYSRTLSSPLPRPVFALSVQPTQYLHPAAGQLSSLSLYPGAHRSLAPRAAPWYLPL